MPREELICPSGAIYEEASAHVNAQALADGQDHKREAKIPAVFRIKNRVFVTTGAWWGDGLELPRQLGIYEVREAIDHEQDDRTRRPPETYHVGRVFWCDMRRWRMLEPYTLLPPTTPQPEQLAQETIF
jgi:hypothetical protein